MKIITNRVPRLIVDDYELTPAERAEFDYLNWAAIENGRDSASFVRYKGQLYDLGEFIQLGNQFNEYWDGYLPDSLYSGVLIHVCRDTDHVIMGRYY